MICYSDSMTANSKRISLYICVIAHTGLCNIDTFVLCGCQTDRDTTKTENRSSSSRQSLSTLITIITITYLLSARLFVDTWMVWGHIKVLTECQI